MFSIVLHARIVHKGESLRQSACVLLFSRGHCAACTDPPPSSTDCDWLVSAERLVLWRQIQSCDWLLIAHHSCSVGPTIQSAAVNTRPSPRRTLHWQRGNATDISHWWSCPGIAPLPAASTKIASAAHGKLPYRTVPYASSLHAALL